MSDSKIINKLRKAAEQSLSQLSIDIKKYLLEQFDKEIGYTSSGEKKIWDELSDWYVNAPYPRGRGGSSHPILKVKGDLRASIRAVSEGLSIDTDIINKKMKPRGGKGSISVEEISTILDFDRPHTNPSPKKTLQRLDEILRINLINAVNELRESGDWYR